MVLYMHCTWLIHGTSLSPLYGTACRLHVTVQHICRKCNGGDIGGGKRVIVTGGQRIRIIK